MSVFVSSAPYKICVKLAEAVKAAGQEFVLPPDMTGILSGRNTNRAQYLAKLVKNGILKQRGTPPTAKYSFIVPMQEIKQKEPQRDMQQDPRAWPKESELKTLDVQSKKRRPSFHLVNEFMNEVNKKSIEVNHARNEVLKKQIAHLKEKLTSCEDGSSEENVLIKELAVASEERRRSNAVAVPDAIEIIAAESKYAEFDFGFFSLRAEDYQ
jgi:hypothetical protein